MVNVFLGLGVIIRVYHAELIFFSVSLPDRYVRKCDVSPIHNEIKNQYIMMYHTCDSDPHRCEQIIRTILNFLRVTWLEVPIQ